MCHQRVLFRLFIVCIPLIAHMILRFIPKMGPRFGTTRKTRELWEDMAIAGEVYHSAEVFRMNYAEMEEKFKIFVYPDDDDQNTYYHLINGKYASELYFFMNIRESRFRTDDPDQAHLFFIPISCHKMRPQLSSDEEMASVVEKYVQGLTLKYPYWNRTLGADHFFMTCHDIDVRATEGVPLLVKNSIRVVCSPSYDSGYIPHKDVSLPLIVQQPFIKPVPAAQNYDIHLRTPPGFWAGINNSDLRNRLVHPWWEDQELDIQNTTIRIAGGMNDFRNAHFCICLVESRLTSYRILLAIHFGCVPVIISDHFDLPFNDVLDWRKFSVILNERDACRLKDILKAKAGAGFRTLQTNVVKMRRHFLWHIPPRRYDAFNMVLYHLWLRRNIVKY